MKTREEVEALKQNWLQDGSWDIYETEGFEEYREELFAFQERIEAESERRFQQVLEATAELIGLPGNLKMVYYLRKLEARIKVLEDMLEKAGIY